MTQHTPQSPAERELRRDLAGTSRQLTETMAVNKALTSAMQGAIDALSQNKTFPADIVAAKNLLAAALKLSGEA